MIELRVLGSLDLRPSDPSSAPSVLSRPKQLALLVYLTVARPGDYHQRDTLLALLWPELDEDRGRTAMNSALYRLRSEFGGGVVVGRGQNAVTVDQEQLWCDAVELPHQVARGRPDRAVDLYRGPFMEGFWVRDAPGWNDWADGQRARLRSLARDALRQLSVAPLSRVRFRACAMCGFVQTKRTDAPSPTRGGKSAHTATGARVT